MSKVSRLSVCPAAGLVLCLALPWLAASVPLSAEVRAAAPEIVVPRIDEEPRLDDFLDMRAPAHLDGRMVRVQGPFVQQQPVDGAPSSQRTDIYMGYDDHNLYVVFVAFDDRPEGVRANLNRRENVFGDDIVEIMIDTFHDRRRAYAFVSNPLGVQWDAIWVEGNRGDRRFDSAWDTVWYSEGKRTDRGYVVRMAIPFKSLRFPDSPGQTWGFIFVRDVPQYSEETFFPRIDQEIEGRLSQAGTLRGIEDVSPGHNSQLIPYGTARAFKLLDTSDTADVSNLQDDFDPDLGLDAKFVFQDRLVLDATVNPDFSQVESDEPQVTVNERFEVFFPEKRPFFLENANFFSAPQDLLFTRRIGEPRIGARLTGKLGKTNLGVLLIDDEAPGKDPALDPADPLRGETAEIGALRVTRDVLRQSQLGLIYTERRFGGGHNRVGGADARFKFGDKWVAVAQAITSSTRNPDGTTLDGPLYDVALDRESSTLRLHWHYRDVGDGFRTDLGFVPRSGFREAHTSVAYNFGVEGKRLIDWEPELFLLRLEDRGGKRLDSFVRASLEFQFHRQTRLRLFFRDGNERLTPADFDALTADADFRTGAHGFSFNSRPWNRFGFNVRMDLSDGINFIPPDGQPPTAADGEEYEAGFSLIPARRLRIDTSFVYRRADDRASGGKIFSDAIARTRWNFQFTTRASLRAILQYDSVMTDPSAVLTDQETTKNLNADLLFSYLVNPWTAFYAGYNTNFQNFELVSTGGGTPTSVVRTGGADYNDSRQFFVKLSYLFQL